MNSYNDTLAATSSLVLLWEGGEIHTSNLSQQYRKLISISVGKSLFDRCNLVWVNYDQVIKNRKNCILNIVNNVLSNNDAQQVVLLGSGLDSLSFEILSRFNSVTIFETDNSNMELKNQHIQEIEPKINSYFQDNHSKII